LQWFEFCVDRQIHWEQLQTIASGAAAIDDVDERVRFIATKIQALEQEQQAVICD
jgi:hypothetical protein